MGESRNCPACKRPFDPKNASWCQCTECDCRDVSKHFEFPGTMEVPHDKLEIQRIHIHFWGWEQPVDRLVAYMYSVRFAIDEMMNQYKEMVKKKDITDEEFDKREQATFSKRTSPQEREDMRKSDWDRVVICEEGKKIKEWIGSDELERVRDKLLNACEVLNKYRAER